MSNVEQYHSIIKTCHLHSHRTTTEVGTGEGSKFCELKNWFRVPPAIDFVSRFILNFFLFYKMVIMNLNTKSITERAFEPIFEFKDF
jgi:hypothetical protein